MIANSLSPTAGTLAATAGGGLAFVVRLVVSDSDAAVVLLAPASICAEPWRRCGSPWNCWAPTGHSGRPG